MGSPCPRCGTIKTESVRHGFIYKRLWDIGYHLRRCSFCNRWRVFKRLDPTLPHPDDMTAEALRDRFNRKIAEVNRKSAARAEAAVLSVEESPAPVTTAPPEPIPEPAAPEPETDEDSQDYEDYHLCVKCGSTLYRRSHRRWYERLLGRPRMARCLNCGHRFPYPR